MKLYLVFIVCFVAVACGSNDSPKEETAKQVRDSISVEQAGILDKAIQDTVATVATPKEISLRFNLTKGKTYNYSMVFDIARKTAEKSMSNKMRWKYDMKVLDDRNGIKTLQATYRQIDMEMDMGTQKMEFSSEKAKEAGNSLFELPSKMFGAIKGKSFTMQVNERGEILHVEGFDKIGEAMVNEMNLPAEGRTSMLNNFKQQFNDEAVKQMFSHAFHIFPAKKVKEGDSWEMETTSLDENNKATSIYTVKEIKGNRVTLQSRSKSGNSGTSTLIIHAPTGLVLDGTYKQVSTGERNMTGKARIIGREL